MPNAGAADGVLHRREQQQCVEPKFCTRVAANLRLMLKHQAKS